MTLGTISFIAGVWYLLALLVFILGFIVYFRGAQIKTKNFIGKDKWKPILRSTALGAVVLLLVVILSITGELFQTLAPMAQDTSIGLLGAYGFYNFADYIMPKLAAFYENAPKILKKLNKLRFLIILSGLGVLALIAISLLVLDSFAFIGIILFKLNTLPKIAILNGIIGGVIGGWALYICTDINKLTKQWILTNKGDLKKKFYEHFKSCNSSNVIATTPAAFESWFRAELIYLLKDRLGYVVETKISYSGTRSKPDLVAIKGNKCIVFELKSFVKGQNTNKFQTYPKQLKKLLRIARVKGYVEVNGSRHKCTHGVAFTTFYGPDYNAVINMFKKLNRQLKNKPLLLSGGLYLSVDMFS